MSQIYLAVGLIKLVTEHLAAVTFSLGYTYVYELHTNVAIVVLVLDGQKSGKDMYAYDDYISYPKERTRVEEP